MQREYYQIFKNRHPLPSHTYATKKEARDNLGFIHQSFSEYADNVGFKVQKRVTAVPSVLALRSVYEDGYTENTNFIIRKVKLQAIY